MQVGRGRSVPVPLSIERNSVPLSIQRVMHLSENKGRFLRLRLESLSEKRMIKDTIVPCEKMWKVVNGTPYLHHEKSCKNRHFQSTPLWKGAPTQRATLEKFDFNGSTEDAENHGRPLIEMVLQITDGPIDTFFWSTIRNINRKSKQTNAKWVARAQLLIEFDPPCHSQEPADTSSRRPPQSRPNAAGRTIGPCSQSKPRVKPKKSLP